LIEIFRLLNSGEAEERLLQKQTAIHQYYSPDDENKYVVVGIYFRVF